MVELFEAIRSNYDIALLLMLFFWIIADALSKKGEKGEKGDRGFTGPKGDKGDRGQKGEPGTTRRL